MENFILFLASLFVIGTSQGAPPASQCDDIESVLKSKISKIEDQIKSIESLLGLGGRSEIPMDILFQVDVSDAEQMARRQQEVMSMTQIDNVFKSINIQELSPCFIEPKKDLNNYAQQLVLLNNLKLRFFELDPNKRGVLIESYNSQRSTRVDQNVVNSEVEKAEQSLKTAQVKLSNTPIFTTDNQLNDVDEDLMIAVASLRQYQADYANDHLDFLKLISEKKFALEEIRIELSTILKEEQKQKSDAQSLLPKANQTWKRTADFISSLFTGLQISTNTALPEPMAPKGSLSDAEQKEYSLYLKEYNEAQKGRLEQTQKRTQIIDDLRSQTFQLLSEVGQLRSRLFLICDQSGQCKDHRSFNSKNLSDIIREIEIIPIKIRAAGISKIIELRGKFSAGVDGWIDLLKQVIALFILLLVPFLLFRLLNWINLQLDQTRRSILSRSMMDFRKRTSIALWLSRINPFVPAVGMSLGVWLARQVVETTDIKELSQFLFYFQLYFIYKISKLIVQIALEVIFASESVVDLRNQKELVAKSARRISRLIFVEYAFLYLIETSVRKALLYGIISSFVFYFNILFILWESYGWDRQIYNAFVSRFPQYIKYLDKFSQSKALLFILRPVLLGFVAVHDIVKFLYFYIKRLDIFKKINSEIFRRRIEADAEGEHKKSPTKEYLQQFDYYLPAEENIIVKRDHSPSSRSLQAINAWLSDEGTDDLMIIVGNRGMGKSTVLDSIAKTLSGDIIVHRPIPKILKEDLFFQFLSAIFKVELKNVEDVLTFDNDLEEKKIILIDDIQNLFLGQIGGFEAYKIFVDILSLKTKNIFWCLSVNSRSWTYLRGAFGKEHLYGQLIELTPWKDFEIQELILKRHKLTGYSRQFDQSIKAYGATGDTLGQQAETQFFRLLWGQSRGNPRSALMYWISAVSQTGNKKVIVGVPSFVSASLVATMSDDSLFLLASIARHESLTEQEMLAVTGIQKTVIRKCMKEAIDKNLVWFDESHRFRISSRAQYVIDYFLTGKNFLYE